MRKFEEWLDYQVTQAFNVNIFYVDLGNIIEKTNYIILSLGYKVKDSRGSYWQSTERDVEIDFTEEEFIKICEKYNIKCSVRIGEY